MKHFAPMLASTKQEPFDSADYLFEVKWDGIRCLCTIEGETIGLHSRNGRDITRLFPELRQLSKAIAARSAVLDGELCVFDGTSPSFHSIQRRTVLSKDIAIRAAAHEYPALYVVFDLLHIDGLDLTELPLSERRHRLEDAWRGTEHATLSVAIAERGRDLYTATIAQGFEGIVAKRLDSPYVPGRRTRHWLKIRHQRELDGVIGGYTPRGKDDFGSLAIGLYATSTTDPLAGTSVDPLKVLSGYPLSNSAANRLHNGFVAEPVTEDPAHGSQPDKRTLTYIGNVGTGFSAQVRRDLMARLTPLRTETSPFAIPGVESRPTPLHTEARLPPVTEHSRIPADTVWVRPQLVCRIGYLQFTPSGHLRHPTFRGLRDDKLPFECTLFSAQRNHPEGVKPRAGE